MPPKKKDKAKAPKAKAPKVKEEEIDLDKLAKAKADAEKAEAKAKKAEAQAKMEADAKAKKEAKKKANLEAEAQAKAQAQAGGGAKKKKKKNKPMTQRGQLQNQFKVLSEISNRPQDTQETYELANSRYYQNTNVSNILHQYQESVKKYFISNKVKIWANDYEDYLEEALYWKNEQDRAITQGLEYNKPQPKAPVIPFYDKKKELDKVIDYAITRNLVRLQPKLEGTQQLQELITNIQNSVSKENPTLNFPEINKISLEIQKKYPTLFIQKRNDGALAEQRDLNRKMLPRGKEEDDEIWEKRLEKYNEEFDRLEKKRKRYNPIFGDISFEEEKDFLESMEGILVPNFRKGVGDRRRAYVDGDKIVLGEREQTAYQLASQELKNAYFDDSISTAQGILNPFLFYNPSSLKAFVNAKTEEDAQRAEQAEVLAQAQADADARAQEEATIQRRQARAEAQAQAQAQAEARRKAGQAQALRDAGRAEKKEIKSAEAKAQQDAQDILDKEAEDKELEKVRLKSIADEEARKARVAELKEAREKRERHTDLVQMALGDPDELTISKLDEDERTIVRQIIQERNTREAQFGKTLTSEQLQAMKDKQSADFEAKQAQDKADADAQAKALQAPKVNERRAELFKRRFGIDERNEDIESIKNKIKKLKPLDASDINMLESIIKFDIQNAEEGEARELEILYQDLNAPPVRLRELIGQLAEGERGRALDEITSGFISDIGTGVADYDRIARATPRKVDRGGGRPIGIYEVGKKKKLLTGEAPYPSAGLLFDKQKKPLGIFPLDIGGMYPQKDDRLSNKSGGEFYGGVPVSIGGSQVNIYHQSGTLPNQSLTDYGDAFIGGRTVLGADRRTPRDFGAFTQLGITATLGATGLANVPTQRFDEDQNPLTRSPPSYRKGTIKSYPLTNEEMNIQQRGNRYSLVRSGRQATYQNINTY